MNAYQKLKQNWEFRRAYNRGVSCVSPAFVLYAVKGKKIGTAVKRNRAKRVVTAAFNACIPHIAASYDYVIVARTRILGTKSTDVAYTLQKQLKQQNLWIE